MDNVIYTIGYSSYTSDVFLEQIKKYDVGCVVDVRSVPFASEFYQAYSRNMLEPFLHSNKVFYRNYASEFGARQENPIYYQKYGYLDFELFIKSDTFVSGVKKIVQGMTMGYRFCLMCAEKDPINCHRAIMVGRGLKAHGFNVKHIMADTTLQTQEYLENRLLDLYFPDRLQASLFDMIPSEDYVNIAYRIQNEKIGYRRKTAA